MVRAARATIEKHLPVMWVVRVVCSEVAFRLLPRIYTCLQHASPPSFFVSTSVSGSLGRLSVQLQPRRLRPRRSPSYRPLSQQKSRKYVPEQQGPSGHQCFLERPFQYECWRGTLALHEIFFNDPRRGCRRWLRRRGGSRDDGRCLGCAETYADVADVSVVVVALHDQFAALGFTRGSLLLRLRLLWVRGKHRYCRAIGGCDAISGWHS